MKVITHRHQQACKSQAGLAGESNNKFQASGTARGFHTEVLVTLHMRVGIICPSQAVLSPSAEDRYEFRRMRREKKWHTIASMHIFTPAMLSHVSSTSHETMPLLGGTYSLCFATWQYETGAFGTITELDYEPCRTLRDKREEIHVYQSSTVRKIELAQLCLTYQYNCWPCSTVEVKLPSCTTSL